MQITYRTSSIQEYWKERWRKVPVDDAMSNDEVYPLKYANLAIKAGNGRILELGCGPGRLLKYYQKKGFDIIGVDYIEEIIQRLKISDPTLNVEVGNATALRFSDGFFGCVLAFGLYHSLSVNDLELALKETFRVMKHLGTLCASFRANNFQRKLLDKRIHKQQENDQKINCFHKLSFERAECEDLLKKVGFEIKNVYCAQNMPYLYKYSFFRSKTHKVFNENLGRKEGYKLSIFGSVVQKYAMKFFPEVFCNLYVVIAQKKS
ncbi:MAG: class I SAM-dependent methyltransferase [Deltaproteobacteria bacterium]|nr:class I SAM-dependent methyltransferase [Deltaproteobacteria bacterium]